MAQFKDDWYRQWARLGAQIRLRELHAEMAEIYRVFPELRSESRSGVTSGSVKGTRRFSSKGKAAISEGMRRYWARRKAGAAVES